MRAVGRLFAALIGFIAAVIAAALFMLVARVGLEPADMNAAPWFWGTFLLAAGYTASLLGSAAFLPAMIAIVITEVLSIRSVMVHVGIGGAIGAIGAAGLSRVSEAGVAFDGRGAVIVAAGFVGGFAYWLVAGRMAGLAPPNPNAREEA
jgi:hypothetical protein